MRWVGPHWIRGRHRPISSTADPAPDPSDFTCQPPPAAASLIPSGAGFKRMFHWPPPTPRQKLLDTAEQIFAANGFQATSLRRVYRAAAGSVRVFGHYRCPSNDRLLVTPQFPLLSMVCTQWRTLPLQCVPRNEKCTPNTAAGKDARHGSNLQNIIKIVIL